VTDRRGTGSLSNNNAAVVGDALTLLPNGDAAATTSSVYRAMINAGPYTSHGYTILREVE
jgi:hypothetical protein